MTRILTVGTDVAGCRRALELAEQHDGRLRDPRHPSARGGRRDDERRRASCASCSRIRRRSRWGRWASTGSATTRRATTSGASSTPQLELAAELGKPVVIHTRAADDDTLAALAGFDGTRRPPLLLVAAPAADRARARLVRLVRRQRELPEGGRPAPRRDAGSRRPDPRRDRLALSRAAARARQAERARLRRPHARRARAGARRGRRPSSRRRSTRNAPHASACEEGVRPALPGRPRTSST